MTDHKIIEIPEEYWPEIEDLPGDLSRIAAEIEQHWSGMGVKMTLFLAQVFRGQPFFIRNIDALIRQIRDDAMRREYDGGDVTMLQLATKWRLGHRRVKQILAKPSSSQAELERKQRSLF